MKGDQFRPEDNFSELYKRLQKLRACSKEALEHYASYTTTTNDAAFSDLRDSKETKQSWAMWMLRVFGDRLHESLRQKCIEKIQTPMEAFTVYLKCDYLTETEDKMLEEKFRDKLPTAEQELRDGIVRREKNG